MSKVNQGSIVKEEEQKKFMETEYSRGRQRMRRDEASEDGVWEWLIFKKMKY